MENLEVTFKKMKPIDKAALYRQALINEGFSADTHLYDLPINRIKKEERNVSRDFILELFSINSLLPIDERTIFINEFLEKGRHYAFWYLSCYGTKTFLSLRKKTIKDISSFIYRKEISE